MVGDLVAQFGCFDSDCQFLCGVLFGFGLGGLWFEVAVGWVLVFDDLVSLGFICCGFHGCVWCLVIWILSG